jgi:hypothetical protein
VEVLHDEFPEQTGWTLRNSAGDLIVSQPSGSYNIPFGTVIQRRNILPNIFAGTYTFEMTDSFGDGICCENGSGSFTITVDGETVISNNGEFFASVQEAFNVEVVYDCSDLLDGCSTVRDFESRTREARVSLAYYMGCRYYDAGNVLSAPKFPSHSLICFCHESRLLWKSSMMSFPRKQAGRSATSLVW